MKARFWWFWGISFLKPEQCVQWFTSYLQCVAMAFCQKNFKGCQKTIDHYFYNNRLLFILFFYCLLKILGGQTPFKRQKSFWGRPPVAESQDKYQPTSSLYQVIPGHGNPQKRRTMLWGYLFKYFCVDLRWKINVHLHFGIFLVMWSNAFFYHTIICMLHLDFECSLSEWFSSDFDCLGLEI